jgi:protein TonB
MRPVYPPLALKMGMQGDVTLKIIVDPEGNVSRAEIVGSSGAEFDQEALKAVKQSRFEPAQKDGQNVAAEFTYVYRFRLQR